MNKFLSLVVAGMLAVTTAATGAISLPGGVAKAVAATISANKTIKTNVIELGSTDQLELRSNWTEKTGYAYTYKWTVKASTVTAGKTQYYNNAMAAVNIPAAANDFDQTSKTLYIFTQEESVSKELQVSLTVNGVGNTTATTGLVDNSEESATLTIKIPAFTTSSPAFEILEKDATKTPTPLGGPEVDVAAGADFIDYQSKVDGVYDWYIGTGAVSATIAAARILKNSSGEVNAYGEFTAPYALSNVAAAGNARLAWTVSPTGIVDITHAYGNTANLIAKQSSGTVTVKATLEIHNGTNWVTTSLTDSLTVAIHTKADKFTFKKNGTLFAEDQVLGAPTAVGGATAFTLSGDSETEATISISATATLPGQYKVNENYRWVSANPSQVAVSDEYGDTVTLSAISNTAGVGTTISIYPINSGNYDPVSKTSTNFFTITVKVENTKKAIIYKKAGGTIAQKDSVSVDDTVAFSAEMNDAVFGTAATSLSDLYTKSTTGGFDYATIKTATGNTAAMFFKAESSNENVLEVSEVTGHTSPGNVNVTGKMTGVSNGTATLTITGYYYETATAASPKTYVKEVQITVGSGSETTKNKVSFGSVNYTVVAGAKANTTVTTTLATGGKWTYASANTNIATISSTGEITGIAAGSTTITATYTVNGKAYPATATVTVSAPSKTNTVALDKSSYSVAVGSTVKAIAYLASGITSSYNPVYSVSDSSIAKVDSSTGVITGIKAGTTILTATIGASSVSATITVTSGTPTPTPAPEPEVPAVEDFGYNDASFDLTTSGTAVFTGSDKNSGTVTIPRYVYYVSGGKTYAYEVTGIADYAFSKSKVRKVKIPATVSYIGYKAFFKCYNLEKVAFEDASNIDEIDDKAFKKTKDGLVLKQKNGEKFDSDIRKWLEKTFKQIVIK